MQERVAMGGNLQEVEQKVNRDLLGSVTGSPPRRYWVAVGLMALLAAAGFGAAGYVVVQRPQSPEGGRVSMKLVFQLTLA